MKEIKSQIKILVACHKPDPCIRMDDIHMPIQVGKDLHPELDLGFQCDNTGENISAKNDSYCELTALYWAWKNLKKIDYIGLCHYRRYFDLSNNSIINKLKRYEGISVKSSILPHNVYKELCIWTSFEDVAIFLDTILTLYPEYKKDIIYYYFLNNKFSQCNMLILAKDKYQEYCTFLFSILKETENKIKKSSYSRQRRVLGYLAETLFGVWQLHNNVDIFYAEIDNNLKRNKLKSFLRKIYNFKVNIDFRISTLCSYPNKTYINSAVLTGLKQDGINLNNIR